LQLHKITGVAEFRYEITIFTVETFHETSLQTWISHQNQSGKIYNSYFNQQRQKIKSKITPHAKAIGKPVRAQWLQNPKSLYQFCVSLRFIRPQAKAWGYTNQACLHRLRTAHFHKETVLQLIDYLGFLW
jgi:hypothetical protein